MEPETNLKKKKSPRKKQVFGEYDSESLEDFTDGDSYWMEEKDYQYEM